jgi:hypothetical protein
MAPTKIFHHQPKRYEMTRMTPENEYLLQRFLSDEIDCSDRPLAVVQRAVIQQADTKSSFQTLGHYSAWYQKGGRAYLRNFAGIYADHQAEAGILAMHLGEDIRLPMTFKFVAAAEKINYDSFMVTPVTLLITHLPHSSVISWSMSSTRAEKLLENQPGMSSRPIGNNPAAAFGTFVQRSPESNHERLEVERRLMNDVERYARIMRSRHPELPIDIKHPIPVATES